MIRFHNGEDSGHDDGDDDDAWDGSSRGRTILVWSTGSGPAETFILGVCIGWSIMQRLEYAVLLVCNTLGMPCMLSPIHYPWALHCLKQWASQDFHALRMEWLKYALLWRYAEDEIWMCVAWYAVVEVCCALGIRCSRLIIPPVNNPQATHQASWPT